MSLAPFRTAPIYVPKVWAGGRLPGLGYAAPPGTGEVWLVADLPGASSVVLDGPAAGSTLGELARERPRELLGVDEPEQTFPLLVKVLDIGPPLSVQLHPDAAVARALGDGERGKCEAWLVLERGADAAVFLGLAEGTSPEEVIRLAEAGGLEERLTSFRPELGEGIEIVPGTLHTAREVAVLEVQETSDITYRVYDWGRERGPLHLEQARAVLERVGAQPAPPRGEGWGPGRRRVTTRSPFTFDAIELADGERLELPAVGRPRVLTVVSGTGSVGGLRCVAPCAVVLPACVGTVSVTAHGLLRLGDGAAVPSQVA